MMKMGEMKNAGTFRSGILTAGHPDLRPAQQDCVLQSGLQRFIGVPLETAKGHKITEYRKSAIAPEVIWSGIPVEGMVRREGTQEYFASVYPIWEEHQIRGSISIVTSLVQFEKRESEAHMTLEERVRRFERQEIQNTLLLYGRDMEGKRKAAKELGISLATLYNKIKE